MKPQDTQFTRDCTGDLGLSINHPDSFNGRWVVSILFERIDHTFAVYNLATGGEPTVVPLLSRALELMEEIAAREIEFRAAITAQPQESHLCQ